MTFADPMPTRFGLMYWYTVPGYINLFRLDIPGVNYFENVDYCAAVCLRANMAEILVFEASAGRRGGTKHKRFDVVYETQEKILDIVLTELIAVGTVDVLQLAVS